MNATQTALQKLAAEVSAMFEQKKRDNGKEFWAVKDGSPKWVTEMCHEAHGDMLPDDHKYEFIVDALQALSDYDDPDAIRDDIEPDPYNYDLVQWLGSHLSRAGYVDEAAEEFGIESKDFDVMRWIGIGQVLEKCEVLDSVRRVLEARIEDNENSPEAA